MRNIAIFAATLAAIVALAQPAPAGMAEDCEQEYDRDLSIGGCTAVIRSGEWQGKSLAWAYYNRANAYRRLGDQTRAIEDYDQALRLDPGYVDAYFNRGLAYHNLGEYGRAVLEYSKALRLDPGDGDTYNNRGNSYKSLGEPERAAADWERAIRIGGASTARWWQKYLNGKGHHAGAVDGIFGPATRRALVACARDPDC